MLLLLICLIANDTNGFGFAVLGWAEYAELILLCAISEVEFLMKIPELTV